MPTSHLPHKKVISTWSGMDFCQSYSPTPRPRRRVCSTVEPNTHFTNKGRNKPSKEKECSGISRKVSRRHSAPKPEAIKQTQRDCPAGQRLSQTRGLALECALGWVRSSAPSKSAGKGRAGHGAVSTAGNLCSMKAGGSWPEHRALPILETSCPASDYRARGDRAIFSLPVLG